MVAVSPSAGADVALVPQQLLEKILFRVIARRRQGRSAQHPTLPEEKSAFPKLLCLDQNQWIYLAQAHAGRGDPRRTAALAAIRAATRKGALVVPILGANADEIVEVSDSGRRARLANFAIELSQNTSALHSVVLSSLELENAAATVYDGRAQGVAIRSALIQRGMNAATMGRHPVLPTSGDAALDALVAEALQEPEIGALMFDRAISRDAIAVFREKDNATANRIQRIRDIDKHLSTQARKILEMKNVLSGGALAQRLEATISKLAIDRELFRDWLREDSHVLAFASAVAGLDVSLTLMLERDKNGDDPCDRNDGKDFSFLQVAVPYANVVLTENRWAHLVRVTGLAKRYGTRVSSKLDELPELLREEGCF